MSVVAASNEVPVDDAVHAFFDRFLVRVPAAPMSDASFGARLALAPVDRAVSPEHALESRRAASGARRRAG